MEHWWMIPIERQPTNNNPSTSNIMDMDVDMDLLLRQLDSSIGLSEKFKITVDVIFRKFCNNFDVPEFIFPAGLSNIQRKYIHDKSRDMRLLSRSEGKEPNRKLHISKSNKVYSKIFNLHYDEKLSEMIKSGINDYETYVSTNRFRRNWVEKLPQNEQVFSRLTSGNTVSVDDTFPNELTQFRKCLPVWYKKDEFLRLLRVEQVIIVTSETGSGKTTQIPQFILEEVCAYRSRCKIICTQPRRLSTIAVAERVAVERGEQVGHTVGYQIKLKSKCSLKSALIYCTNGVLLRTLMNDAEDYLKNVTHIIVDEIHERDKYTDFLLICLKQCLDRHKHLKLILMSATADVQQFKSYFGSAKLLDIPGSLYTVQEIFLGEILMKLGYDKEQSNVLQESELAMYRYNGNQQADSVNLPVNTAEENMMNEVILACMHNGDEDSFEQLLHLILSENGDVNQQTPIDGYTPLMAAAAHGNVDLVEQLLNLGADTSLVSNHNGRKFSATNWANYYNKVEVCQLITLFDSVNGNTVNLNHEKHAENVLNKYYETISEEAIDFALIVKIIELIHDRDKQGTILIFLPGYEDIINCQDKILLSKYLNLREFKIFMLHGSMNIAAQYGVFNKIPNKQKIVLSTNIAETSITIPDVVYVIDTGRVKEKSYDSVSGICALSTIWISKASVKQRTGRAGRTQPGLCFRTFSLERYKHMVENHVPEILRVPLHELCLQTKLLAPKNLKIAEYLELAMEPPQSASVKSSIESLIKLGALNANEELTYLGQHLLQLSLEPRLGKMLIYAAVLKCLDPILTIVACLTQGDVFVLPQQSKQKQLANKKQKELAGNTYSDHLTLLRAYQFWQEVQVRRQDRYLLQEYFINTSAMEAIHATRAQLMSQLRGTGFVGAHKSCNVQELNINSSKWPVVKAALTAGCYPDVAFLVQKHFATKKEKKVIFNRGSVLNNFIADKKNVTEEDYCVVYEELGKTGKQCSIKCGTIVTPITVALICGNKVDELDNNLIIDDWLDFQHQFENLAAFRNAIKVIINNKIVNPHYNMSTIEQNMLDCLINILRSEDQRVEFIQPSGIGLTPKLFLNVNSRYCEHQVPDVNNHHVRQNDWRSYNHTNNQQVPTVTGLPFRPLRTANINRALPRDDVYKNTFQTFPNSTLWRNQNVGNQNVQINNRQYVGQHGLNGENSGDSFLKALSGPKHVHFEQVQNGSTRNNDILPLRHLELPQRTVFFIIKPPNCKILQIGITQGKWMFAPHSERKIFKFFNQGFYVILFFTISKTQEFQGLARLLGTNQGDVSVSYPIKWLSTSFVSYEKIKTRNIRNPYNQNLLVYDSNDGQEIEYNSGRQLCELFCEEANDSAGFPTRTILGSSRNNNY